MNTQNGFSQFLNQTQAPGRVESESYPGTIQAGIMTRLQMKYHELYQWNNDCISDPIFFVSMVHTNIKPGERRLRTFNLLLFFQISH